MPYEIKKLSAPHHVMVELELLGLKPGEIAERLGYTREGVTVVQSSPCYQHELARRRANHEQVHDQTVASTVVEARAKLDGLAEAAVDKLKVHLESADARISMMSVKEILDRADGLAPTKGPVQVEVLNADRMQLLLLAVRESGRASIVDGQLIKEHAA